MGTTSTLSIVPFLSRSYVSNNRRATAFIYLILNILSIPSPLLYRLNLWPRVLFHLPSIFIHNFLRIINYCTYYLAKEQLIFNKYLIYKFEFLII